MSEPQTSATWDGQPVKPTCGCGGHHTSADRCQDCGACGSLPHSRLCPAAGSQPMRKAGTSDA